jgi:hypothetical protein
MIYDWSQTDILCTCGAFLSQYPERETLAASGNGNQSRTWAGSLLNSFVTTFDGHGCDGAAEADDERREDESNLHLNEVVVIKKFRLNLQ